jgi:hypothetical protein
LLALPVHAKKPAPTPAPEKPKTRRYKMADVREQTLDTPLERFLMGVGTLGLIYFWPGARFQLKSNNANIELNGPRR